MANPTTNLNITLPVPGSSSSKGTWGETINDAVQSLDTGIAERGVPAGGTNDQILTKNGTDNYATEWTTLLSITDAERTKLSGIETAATADQTGAEIKTAYESESNTNAYTDAEKTKLSGVEASATADQTNVEIKTAYEANSDTNAYTDAEKTKVGNLSGANTGDQTTITGNAATATALETARTIGGMSFDGTANINLPGVNMFGNQSTSGDAQRCVKIDLSGETVRDHCYPVFSAGSSSGAAATGYEVLKTCASKLSFDSSTGILSATGFSGAISGAVTGNADTATSLETARTIGGVSFNGTANIDLPGVNAAGSQDTTGAASKVTVASESVASSQTISNQHFVDSTALFSCANHGLAEDQPIIITLSGTGPTNVTSGTIYYVRPGVTSQHGSGLAGTANNFKISTSPGGSSVSSSGTSWEGSANHTFEKVRYPLFALSPTGDLPAKSGGGVTLTASGKLTATSFSGPLTGDVTGTASGIADGIVSEAKMQISNTPTNGHVLTARSGNTGGMTWEAAGGSFEPVGTAVAMAIALG